MENWKNGWKKEQVGIKVTPGEIYTTHFTGLRYKVIGICKDWPSEQLKVLHQGLDGFDKGNFHTCSVMHFALNFKLAEATPEVNVEIAVVERVADNLIKGSGV